MLQADKYDECRVLRVYSFVRWEPMCLAMPKPRSLSAPKTLAIFLSGTKYCLLSGS